MVQLALPVSVRAGQWLPPAGPVLSVQSSHSVGSRACGGECYQLAGSKGLCGQCQGLASSWGGPGAPQVGRSRRWLKLDEDAASTSCHIQITGTLGGGYTASLEERTLRDQAEVPTLGCSPQAPGSQDTPVLHGAGLLGATITASARLILLPQLHVQLVARL